MEIMATCDVQEVLWPGKTFAINRSVLSFDKLSGFYSKSYEAIYSAIRKLGIKRDGPPCAINFAMDREKAEADLAAAVPVPAAVHEIEGFQKITIPKSKALMLTYFGEYEQMGTAYSALEHYLSTHQLQKALFLEEYLPDPPMEKDLGKWKTNIYVILK